MAVSKQPTITPETSSGEGLDEEPSSRGEAKWKRFHPFRVVRKIFRRRVKREGTPVVSDASKKSWSTSELQSVQDDGAGKCDVTSPLKIGLSVSHDSIFSPENNASVNSEELNVPRGSSLSVRHSSIKNMFKDELFTRVRARRDSDDDDDDIGLPHSPCTSPTTVDVLTQALKEKTSKSQTTCSAGSLISMGSSENDEDSAGQSSGHSSRMSLLDRRSLDSEGDPDFSQPVPLNHNAAHHKIAVRPKRTYGLPRRRMNQIAAAKVSALPSTPEVTEDHAKVFQKLDSTEVIKTLTEYSTSVDETTTSTIITSERQSSAHVSSSFYEEMSPMANEITAQEVREKSFSEAFSETLKMSTEEESKMSIQELSRKFDPVNLAGIDRQNNKSDDSVVLNEFSECTNKTTPDLFSDIKHTFMEKSHDTTIESFRLVKNSLQENIKSDFSQAEDYVVNNNESSVSVSSLVKNIEKSDSFKSVDKIKKSVEETALNFNKNFSHDEVNFSSDKKSANDHLKGNFELKSDDKIRVNPVVGKSNEGIDFESSDNQKVLSPECSSESLKKNTVAGELDVDSEFILKPVRKELKIDSDLDSKELKVEDKQKENSLISSLYLEEESIMSSKSLSMGIEESRIFISHHASFSDDLKDILVTEAHNFAAVEDKAGVSVQTSSDRAKDMKKEKIEPYISSVGISTVSSMTDVTVNSSTSTLCDSKMMEDKITISVNSKPDALKSNFNSSKKDDAKQSSTELQKSVLTSKAEVNQKVTVKEKQQLKQTQKSHLPDVTSNTNAVKNGNAQKRVSVEIVPFSQRMKERKYQPISFTNKETSAELKKKNSNAVVERKFSDRKLTTKNKELDKSNNRHSFSGTFTMESKKEGETIVEKKVTKPEKLQYPVQIRIHKSVPKPEVKDRLPKDSNNSKEVKNLSNKEACNDVKFQMQSAKIAQNESKLLKDEKLAPENAPKWEIKIQPAAPHSSISSQTASSDEVAPSFASQSNFFLKNESLKSASLVANENKDHANQEIESPSIKSQENNWKTPKDAPLTASDDPEPELLRVFARRSIKQKHCDKRKPDEKEDKLLDDTSCNDSFSSEKAEENTEMISISHNSTVIKISENSKSHISKPDLKKKSKSFCEKEKIAPRSSSPLKEMNLIRRESPTKLISIDSSICTETVHPRQRLASVSDVPFNLPTDTEKRISSRCSQNESSVESSPAPSVKEEHLHKASSLSTPSPATSVNESLTNLGMVKENQEMLGAKEAHAPSWLQLAQQRRELREQRERLLLGGSPNSFMDASNKPSRSSKVWDMVNNFQKLQMT